MEPNPEGYMSTSGQIVTDNQWRAEHEGLYGTGKITIIMVVNLGRFMAFGDVHSRNLFRRLRGTSEYITFLRKMKVDDLFIRLDRNRPGSDPWIETHGYDIGVFRHHLVENWFFPTFELKKDDALLQIRPEFKESHLFKQEWNRWDHFKLRLTRNGFIQVKLSRKFENMDLHELNAQLLEFERDGFRHHLLAVMSRMAPHEQAEIKPILQYTLQWQLAYQVIDLFIRELGSFNFNSYGKITLTMPMDEEKTPIRDKYTIIFFREMGRKLNGARQRITTDDIMKDKLAIQSIRSMWDGTLFSDRASNTIHYPEYRDSLMQRVHDDNLSYYRDELSLIGPERAVIFCPQSDQSIYLPFRGGKTKHGVRYNDYWKCIIRGFEHILALRNELQMVEAYTNREMNKVSRYTHALTTHGISRREIKDVRQLSRRVARLYNILVSIRSVLVVPSTYRASYAVDKFKKLNQVLGMEQIEEHVEKNIQELNFFISHYNNLVIQQNGERLQRYAIGFGVAFAFLGVASLLKDAYELSDVLGANGFWESVREIVSLFWTIKPLAALLSLWMCLLLVAALLIRGGSKISEMIERFRKRRHVVQ
ncbi:hypothetical protein JW960_14925 [candidate division KSB1 bacterium]|nr:hypothetical protein [candidate division KSB1 bacterium]